MIYILVVSEKIFYRTTGITFAMKRDELGVYQDGKMRRKCVRFQIAQSTIELVWMVIAQVHSFVIVTLDGKL